MWKPEPLTQAEIKQYADIYMRWWNRDKYAIPVRYSWRVKSDMEMRKFIVNRGAVHSRTRHINTDYISRDITDLPDAVIWHMLKPTIEKYTGYSITTDRIWIYDCNFYEGDTLAIEKLLIRLHMAGFITFYSAGSIWRIEIVAK